MKTTHSLISPSNFERRKICPGSLKAEKDLPNTTSKYAEEGTMLHDRVNKYITGIGDWELDLSIDQKKAVEDAKNYFFNLTEQMAGSTKYIHEKKFDLSFIYKDMKGTVDSLILNENEVHVIDYKFGRGIRVNAKCNYQLLLYYLGAINDPENIDFLAGKDYSVHLHIVAPFLSNSVWSLTASEKEFYSNLDMYREVAKMCYVDNAPRVASKKGCQFCKASATCPALASFVPDVRKPKDSLFDSEIAKIYEDRELINIYLKSIEEYIKGRLDSGSFLDYTLRPKLSKRKWGEDAENYLSYNLGSDAFEVTKKLIGITKAEKILGKQIVNSLTTKEESDVEIVKISKVSSDIFKTFNND